MQDQAIEEFDIPHIRLEWSTWAHWEAVAQGKRAGGVSPPDRPGVYEAKHQASDDRLTIGKAASLRMRVRQGLVTGKLPHPAGMSIWEHEDLSSVVVRWAETERPAAAEEELHLRHVALFGHLPKYTYFT